MTIRHKWLQSRVIFCVRPISFCLIKNWYSFKRLGEKGFLDETLWLIDVGMFTFGLVTKREKEKCQKEA